MQKKASARAGRPRDENVHRAILEAARELIRVEGYASFSIEGVASRAGVAKQSIYRRWSSKGALLIDLYMDGLELPAPLPARGLANDLLAVLLQTTKRVQDPTGASSFSRRSSSPVAMRRRRSSSGRSNPASCHAQPIQR